MTESQEPADDTTLELYLRYETTDTEVKADGNIYKAFGIEEALSVFRQKSGKSAPTKIKIWAK